MAEPRGLRVVSDPLPGVPSDWTRRDGIVKADIDSDILRYYPRFHTTSMGMLSTASEDLGRFNVEIGNFLRLSIYQTVLIGTGRLLSIFDLFLFGLIWPLLLLFLDS